MTQLEHCRRSPREEETEVLTAREIQNSEVKL
jgi:hypothetical protein